MGKKKNVGDTKAIRIYGPYKSKNGGVSYHIQVPGRPQQYIFPTKEKALDFLKVIL